METESRCGGLLSSAVQASSGKHAKKQLKICEYITQCPRCSCKKCDVGFVDRESGNILCCNQHMFTYQEIAAANGYIVPVVVPHVG